MKKTFLKVLCLCLSALMLAGMFVGCGKKDETYVIGCTGPLSGDAASYGISVKNGAMLAVEEINAAGGLNGVKFTFEMVDDEAKGDKATTGYETLLGKGMQVALGSVTTGSALAFAEASKEDNLFFITPSASADDVIAGANGYRVCFGDPDQGMFAAEELVKTYNKIGVIYNADDTYSTGLLAGFETKMAALNKADAYVKQSFGASTNKAFDGQVAALKAAGCDVVFLPIYYKEASLIIGEAAKQGYEVAFFGCDGMDGIVGHVANDASLAEEIKGLKYLSPIDVNSTDDKVKGFVDAYKAKYNAVPDQFAADGYDAVYVIFEAMKAAGVDDVNISADELCKKLTGVLQGDFTYAGVTGTMTWNAQGAAVKNPYIITIE